MISRAEAARVSRAATREAKVVRSANAKLRVRALSEADTGIHRGSVRTEDLPSSFVFPAWAGSVDPSHKGLRFVGGVLGCCRCGGFSATAATNSPLLAGKCRGFVPAGSQSRLNKFLRGRVPPPWDKAEAWPDERAPTSEPRWPLHLTFREGAWRPSLAASVAEG